MRDGFVKVAAVTPKIKVADPEYNRKACTAAVWEAAEKGARVIVLPELVLSSYTCNDLFLQGTLLKGCSEQLLVMAQETAELDAVIFVGLPLAYLGKLYNVAAVLHRGKILAFITKKFMPNYAEFYEARYFTPGPDQCIDIPFGGHMVPFGTKMLFQSVNLPELVIGCEICEDMWVPDSPSTGLAMAGATLLVNLSASDETVGKDSYRRMLISAMSAKLLAGYIYTSAGDGESTQDIVFGGHNIIAENGTILAESSRFHCETVMTEIDVYRMTHERRRMSTFHPVPDGDNYRIISFCMENQDTALSRVFYTTPFVPGETAARNSRCSEILDIQTMGLKKRLEHIGCQCAVIGVSGGLDSTLALLIIVRAFDLLGIPRNKIETITMPCFGTTERTRGNSWKLMEILGTNLTEIDIKEAVDLHFRDIGQDPDNHDVTYENCQARERTQILMDMANKKNGIVIGTGDMSELALGWATYNGDHMSMYGVNVGVPKTLVKYLVRYYAETCEDQALREVLLDILDTPVSPELIPPVNGQISQKTENLIGDYILHDFFLYYMLRYGFSYEKILRIATYAFAGQFDHDTIEKWLRVFFKRFFSQQFKRSCMPDGPKIGSVALSPRGDLRMPSDASREMFI